MLVLVGNRGHPASLQTVHELCMMVGIRTDDPSGGINPEARQPLPHALRTAREMASMRSGTPPLITEYLLSVYTWAGDQSSSSGGSISNISSNHPRASMWISRSTLGLLIQSFGWR